jgi:hypothetical protein
VEGCCPQPAFGDVSAIGLGASSAALCGERQSVEATALVLAFAVLASCGIIGKAAAAKEEVRAMVLVEQAGDIGLLRLRRRVVREIPSTSACARIPYMHFGQQRALCGRPIAARACRGADSVAGVTAPQGGLRAATVPWVSSAGPAARIVVDPGRVKRARDRPRVRRVSLLRPSCCWSESTIAANYFRGDLAIFRVGLHWAAPKCLGRPSVSISPTVLRLSICRTPF